MATVNDTSREVLFRIENALLRIVADRAKYDEHVPGHGSRCRYCGVEDEENNSFPQDKHNPYCPVAIAVDALRQEEVGSMMLDNLLFYWQTHNC